MGAPGKLTRLPFALSEELHQRLLDELPGKAVCDWINAQPAARAVFDQWFDGRDVTQQNLSDYKAGPKYAEWKKKREALEAERADTEFVISTAREAGMDLGDAGDAIFISRLMEVLRDNKHDPETVASLVQGYAKLRAASVARGALAVREKEGMRNERKLDQADRKLSMTEKQMERNTVTQFLKWARSPEAQAILSSGKPQTVQMDLLHDLMFGKRKEAQ